MTIVYTAAQIQGLAADTKPTDVQTNRKFFETDTGDSFNFNGTTWDKISAPKSQFVIVIPRVAKSTTSSETFDLDGGAAGFGIFYKMPYAGRVTKITISHDSSMGDGEIWMNFAGVQSSHEAFSTTGVGVLIFEPTDWDFVADDNATFEIIGSAITNSPIVNIGVTLAVELDLV